MLTDLTDFVYKEVLGGDPTRKSLFVLLEKEKEKAVLLCNKQAFEEDDNQINKWIKTAKLNLLAKNDKYGNYEMALDPELDFKFIFLMLKTTLIYPANDFDIQKYRRQEAFLIYETPEDYKNITCLYLAETNEMQNLKWVYNFLDKKSEEERIIFENSDKQKGFILAPDLKWNGTNLDELYLLAVAHRRDLHSIRDLTPNELPLLENIRDECSKLINEKYGLKKCQLKMYFHYQPTFYHLHVHIVHIKYEAPGLGVTSVLLDTVIENLKIFPDYYAKATLPFIRKEGDLLYKKYKEAGRV